MLNKSMQFEDGTKCIHETHEKPISCLDKQLGRNLGFFWVLPFGTIIMNHIHKHQHLKKIFLLFQ